MIRECNTPNIFCNKSTHYIQTLSNHWRTLPENKKIRRNLKKVPSYSLVNYLKKLGTLIVIKVNSVN